MKKLEIILFATLVIASCCQLHAQNRLDGMVKRLQAFGAKLPQEQIFLHMDNNCYYLGDTIYYKAYVKRGDTGRPTNLSGILYCELLGHDGYLVERQMIPLEKGEAHGNFVLTDSLLYAGYYELRAYTRWQLNWGVTEHPHSQWAEKYFFSKDMARDYYRDYEKLYSRVFPVYNKPLSPGDFTDEMTLRPLASYYKPPSESPETNVQFFPEGGSMVAGIPQRVAWEVRNEHGQALEGELRIVSDGETINSATVNRGRGVFEITPQKGQDWKATFTPSAEGDNPKGARPTTVKLPMAVEDGVSLSVDTDTSGLSISYTATGKVRRDTLGLTVMRNGVLHHFSQLESDDLRVLATEAGVYQVTVFNTEGRVYADRLCFFLPTGFKVENVSFSGVKEKHYEAFEQITFEIQGVPQSSMSVSVRDAAKSEYVYDTGNMLTEALLASQIRGFVPQPQWYFQKDEPQRRQALDLLMMVQGWRRYSWTEMALPGEFELLHTPENRYPHWIGQIHNYTAEQVLSVMEQKLYEFAEQGSQSMAENTESEGSEDSEQQKQEDSEDKYSQVDEASSRFNDKEENLKYPVALHAEFSQPGTEGVDGDMRSQGTFSMDFPRYYGEFFFFLGASDTTKWKDGNPPIWTQNGRTSRDEVDFPEFYVKLDPVFPRFPKPYDYYQSHVAPMPKDNPLYNSMDEQVRMLSEVTIGARRSGRRRFGSWKPAFVVDAYEAFNATCDAGFAPGYFMGYARFGTDVARTYIGDMKTERKYDVAYRFDGKAISERTALQQSKQRTDMPQAIPESVSFSLTDNKLDKYNYMWNLSDVVVYTDFSPRNDSNNSYKSGELPSVTIDLRLLKDGEVRSYQKNRRWKMKGFAVPDEFYSPNYSNTPLPKEDYRRTLYWNPNVTLDANGRASISLYNNSSSSILQIQAEGWTQDGTPQCGNLN